MTSQIVTHELPRPLYERLRSRAAQVRRSIEAETRELPEVLGGVTEEENLWLACSLEGACSGA